MLRDLERNNPTASRSPLQRVNKLSSRESPLKKGSNPSPTDSPLQRGNISTKKFPLEKGVATKSVRVTSSTITEKSEGIINSIGIIKANLKLKPRSNLMSRNMTKSEQLIWFNILSKRQLLGYKFTKQKILFNYIVDFYCKELLLAIEIDGESHNETQDYDKERTRFINSIGIKVLRFTNQEVVTNRSGIRIFLENYIKANFVVSNLF